MAPRSISSDPRIVHTLLSVLVFQVSFHSAFAQQLLTGFTFRNNNFSDALILCDGDANIQNHSMDLTPATSGNTLQQIEGRCYYKDPVQIWPSDNSNLTFSTMFSFNIIKYPTFEPGDGFVFFISPDVNWTVGTGETLGWLTNETANNFAVAFDIHEEPDGVDHVAINVTPSSSLIRQPTSSVGIELTTDKADDFLFAWIDYDGYTIEVALSKEFRKPCKPLISVPMSLQGVLLNEMYLGFSASTGIHTGSQIHIYHWSFNSSGKATNILGPDEDCKEKVQWAVIFGSVCGCVVLITVLLVLVVLLVLQTKKVAKLKEALAELEDLDCGPRKFSFSEIKAATRRFSKPIGRGGSGEVYRGTLCSKGRGKEIAVKKIRKSSDLDVKMFISEVKVVGVLKHKNLVRVLGWCYEQVGEMFLVYEYMPNRNLRELITENDFSWERRLRSLREVAAALVYLHEECERQIIHYDVKSNNIMLDKDFNACLGDFGTSRLYNPDKSNAIVAFTLGYVAPECHQTGTGSPKSDVHSFGILLLEIVTGSNPQAHDLRKWVWGLHEEGKLSQAIDRRLRSNNNYKLDEMEKVLKLGLICCVHDNPDHRPTMRQVYYALRGEPLIPLAKIPPLPMDSDANDAKFRFHQVIDPPTLAHNGHTVYATAPYSAQETIYYNASDSLIQDEMH